MLICCQSPAGAATGFEGPDTRTRPSAGEMTMSPADGTARSGSRKKNKKTSARAANGDASNGEIAHEATARTRAPRMNGHPAGSAGTRVIDPYLTESRVFRS